MTEQPPDWKQDQAETSRLAPARSSAESAELEIWQIISEDVKERIAEGDGMWATCSGCHESVDGYSIGYPHSKVFGCKLGSGCRECGGIGAVWDTTDYEHMGRTLAAEMLTGDAAQSAGMREALERSVLAIDDWLNIHAAELCDPDRVREARERIGQYGTLSYIAKVQEQNRAALASQPSPAATVEAGDITESLNARQAEINASMARPSSSAASERAEVSIVPMALSDGRTDYFVQIKVGDRAVTPHVFREEYKSAYHVALYDWLLNGTGAEPDCVEFGPDDWPGRVMPAVPQSSGVWQPIETAPIVEWGKSVDALVYSPQLGIKSATIGNNSGYTFASVSSYNGNAVENWGVTHWMPLPSCPLTRPQS